MIKFMIVQKLTGQMYLKLSQSRQIIKEENNNSQFLADM